LAPTLPVDCRKIVYSTTNIITYDFTITVTGDDSKTKITPQILIIVGCHSLNWKALVLKNQTQQYYVGQTNSFIDYVTETQVMDSPDYFCETLSYFLNIKE
jgi:hypothetical protein